MFPQKESGLNKIFLQSLSDVKGCICQLKAQHMGFLYVLTAQKNKNK